jgi:hypothetical protein
MCPFKLRSKWRTAIQTSPEERVGIDENHVEDEYVQVKDYDENTVGTSLGTENVRMNGNTGTDSTGTWYSEDDETSTESTWSLVVGKKSRSQQGILHKNIKA